MLKWNKFSNVVCLVIEGGNSAMDLLTARDTDESANKLSCLFKHKVAKTFFRCIGAINFMNLFV